MSIKSFISSKWLSLRNEIVVEDLVKQGLVVGENFSRQEGSLIDKYHCWLITIGDNVTLAPRVHILAHDASTKSALGYTRIGLVDIGNNVFVGASTTILPGVKIGDNVVIGAGSVVSRDIPSNSVAAGNPARVICSYDDFVAKKTQEMNSVPTYTEKYTLRNPDFTDEMKKEMKEALKKGRIGYVE